MMKNKTDVCIFRLADNKRMSKKALKSIILSLIIGLFSFISVKGQNPFIPKYDAVKRSERCFTVTWEANNQFGAVWWADKVDFSRDTAFNFVVYMGQLDGNGADGLAFVMHQDPRDTITDTSQQVIIGGAGTWDLGAATGDDGGGLGFAMHQSREGPNTIPGPHGPGDDPENHKIQKSVAVEMDTWNNTDVPDGLDGNDANAVYQSKSPFYGWDHTAVIYNGDLYGGQQVITDAEGNTGRILPLKPDYAFGSANNPDGTPHHNIEDDRCYLFQINWEVNPDGTQSIELWADVYNGSTNIDGLQMIMTHTDDMINNVFGGDPIMRFGFTGSTGGAINEQTICLLGENLKPFAQDDFASIPMNTSTVVDVEANDNDPDGDQLHVPIIIESAKHGQAVIFDSLNVNYLRYTPNTNYVGVDTIGYVTCDVNSTKCYAKCDTAFVFIDVGCVPFDIALNILSANTVCSISVPANGAAEAIISGSALAGTLWYEGFEGLSDGTTSDIGTSAWSFTTSGSCNNDRRVEVEANRFRARKTGCEVIFETQAIDISSVSDVSIAVDLQAVGDMEVADYLEVYYILDGGVETALSNGLYTDNFGTAVASVNGLNGNSVQIRIKAKNSGDDEIYYWDNIHLTAIGAGIPNVSFYWYNGNTVSGAPVYTGAIHNAMNHGIYTVQAIDNNTGCPSNPMTVTIDSTGHQIPGGFIEQLSPFTNCELPYDGMLGAGIIDGTDTVTIGYNFSWYHQEDPKIPSFIQRTGTIAQNLESREYTVVITEISTGCDTTINAEVPNAVSIPTITATKLADILMCNDPLTGSAEASVGGVTNGYNFEWYAGPSIGAGPPDYTGSSINTFPVGTFTVQAIDGITSCPSDPATINILDLTNTPDIIANVISDQISCDTLNPTGEVSGQVNVGGTPTTSGFTFNWYKGQNDIIPAKTGYTDGPAVDGLETGVYRLIVVEDATNCTSFEDVQIQDMTLTPPDITLDSTDVTSCDTPNGSIAVNLASGENATDYIYEVYTGNGVVPSNLLLSSNSNIIQDLDVGSYTVIARDIVTKCVTNPAFTTINDATVNPDATITIQDQISCDPASLTGQIAVTMGFGAITDYTYEWFEDDLLGASLAATNVDGNVISGLDFGDYALRVTNNNTLCTNVYYPTVSVNIVLPVEVVSSIPSDYCGADANGELHGQVSSGTAPYTGFTFIWESVVSGNLLPDISADVTGVIPGDYILTIRNDNTQCESSPAPITVDDISVTPIPTFSVTDDMSCGTGSPTGEIAVTITNEDPTYGLAHYTYTWYDAPLPGGTLVATTAGPNGEIANTLAQGTYQLNIENNVTKCTNTSLSVVNKINIKPIIDGVTPDPAENCIDPYNSGAAITTINGGAAIPVGYTFVWNNLDVTAPVIVGQGSSISDYDATDETLPPGNYEVIAYNAFNCPSDPVTFEIIDASTAPVFSIMANNDISCDASGVGSLITVRPNESYTISQYEWFHGSSLISTTTVDSTYFNIDAGNYAVRITDAATGCTSLEYASIQHTPANKPIIQNILVKDLMTCSIPGDGELGYQVIPFENEPPFYTTPRTYTFDLNGNTLQTSGTDNVTFTSLSNGNYTAFVIDDFTHCQSDPISNTLSEAPGIIISSTALQLPTSCGTTNGILQLEAETLTNNLGVGGTGFNFDWFRGEDGSNGAVPFTTAIDNFSSSAVSLTSDYYFVEITDNETSCKKDTAIFLQGLSTPTIQNVLVTPSNSCDPGNGAISTALASFPVGRGYADYNFLLFEGTTFDNVNGTNNLVSTVSTPAAGPVIFPVPLKPGFYTIVVREDFGTICFSDPVVVEVELDFDFPDFAFTITPDKSCPSGTGTGQLVETALPVANIDYQWYLGTDTSIGNISNTNSTASNIYSGTYTLVAEITSSLPVVNGLGCVQDSVINLPKVLDIITLVASTTPSDNCAPYFNGEIEITDVLENTASIGAFPGNYVNYTLYDNSLSSLFSNDTATPWTSLSPGVYYLNAQNDDTKCYTEFYRTEIEDQSSDPVIAITLHSPDIMCDISNGSGELSVSVVGDPSHFDHTWYFGDQSGAVVSDTIIAQNLTASNSTQIYTAVVEDMNGADANLGCISSMQYTLTHSPNTVSIFSSDIALSDQTICGPNGSIIINSIHEEDNSGPILGSPSSPDYTGFYSAQLLDNQQNTLAATYPFNPIDGRFGTDNIPAGTYYVQAANELSKCSFGPTTQVIVKDISKRPVISALLDSPDFACIGGTPTGQLTAVFEGGSDGDNLAANFDVNWYIKGTGTSPNGGNTAIELAPGIYTLIVKDTNGDDQECETSRDYIINAARQVNEITASGNPQTICIPDGVVQIDGVSVNGSSVLNPHTSWTGELLDIDKGTVATNPAESGFVSDMPFSGITAGTYFTRAQDNATKCYSNLFQVVLEDISTNPVIAVNINSPQYSLNPNPASWTGMMNAIVNESDGTIDDYNYDWYLGIGISGSLNENDSVISMLDDGLYTIVAENTITGCSSTFYIDLPFVFLEPVFLTSVNPLTICAPYNGSIEITEISLEGNPDMLADYTFDFHHDNFLDGDTPDTQVPGNDSGTIYNDLNPGSFYIVAKENWWMLESFPVLVEVMDSTTNPIIIFDAASYHPLTSCNEDIMANGALAVDIYEDQSNPYIPVESEYGYTWINEQGGQVISGEITNVIDGLKSGDYRVIVVNQYNNCSSEKVFTIEDESTTPILVASQTPNTNCPIEIANGITNATVINSTSSYNFEWYDGSEVKNIPDYSGQFVYGLPSGIYTVMAIDPDLSTCVSEPLVIHVEDATVNPTVLVNELSPVTNCDPERANGVLTATTQDGVEGHTFEWYLDEELIASGSIASDLGLFDYNLIVTNSVTLCKTTMTSGPSKLLSIVPPPNVDILNDRTSCLQPDGIATASLYGDVTNHIFRYYNKFSGDQLGNYYDDYKIYDLDTSTYRVTAEDRVTGCISEPTDFAIANETYYPQIDVIVDPSNCQEPSGAANVIISDITRDYKVTWYGDNGFQEQLKEIVYIPVGVYKVDVEGTDGCITSTEAEVKGEILIYNGVSANYDGLNDFFQVVCLEYFPDNNVKIFNRAGLMVYEQNYYDMNDPERRFDGFSNKGAIIAGNKLPTGTYFYIVDKKDGSKAKAGYLELNR